MTTHKFFIVGCPRSGTTLLQQALNRHPQIVIPTETKFFFFLLGRSLRWQVAQVRRINAELRINLPIPVRRIRTVTDARQLYEAMAESYLARLGRSGTTHFGEKSPEHLRRLSTIRWVFPAARIILMYRDGRDVALSLCRVPWMHSDLFVDFAVWLWYYRLQRQAARRGWPNLMCVRYEDLVTEPDRTLRAILDFLDLPYVSEVASGSGNKEGVLEWEYPWKAHSFERISSTRVGAWRHELSVQQVRILERWGGRVLRSLGYELATNGTSPLPLLFLPRLYGRVCLWRARKMIEWWLKPPPARLPLELKAEDVPHSRPAESDCSRIGEHDMFVSCPDPETLNRHLAEGWEFPADVTRHIEGCVQCQRKLELLTLYLQRYVNFSDRTSPNDEIDPVLRRAMDNQIEKGSG